MSNISSNWNYWKFQYGAFLKVFWLIKIFLHHFCSSAFFRKTFMIDVNLQRSPQ